MRSSIQARARKCGAGLYPCAQVSTAAIYKIIIFNILYIASHMTEFSTILMIIILIFFEQTLVSE